MDEREVYGKLGGLEATVKNISDNLHAMRVSQEAAAERAEQARRALHAKVDDVSRELASLDKMVTSELVVLREHVADVDEKATSAKSAADDYRRVVQQGKGALFIVGLGGTSIGAAVLYFFDSFIQWLRIRMGM